jgi:hypothetical protein
MRLVEIVPAANDSDPVVCTLRAVTFGSRPKFEALSYRWGTEESNDPITLNGFPFKIKKNLLHVPLFFQLQFSIYPQTQSDTRCRRANSFPYPDGY